MSGGRSTWLENAREADALLRFLLRAYEGRVALSASFGGGGVVLAHMVSRIDARVPVLFLDTGFHFSETIAFKNRFAQRYGLRVVDLSTAPDAAPDGLYRTDPDRCCRIRKVQPMERALADFDVWITALRREQSEARRSIEVVERHEIGGRSILKVMPLAHWPRGDVNRIWQRRRFHRIPCSSAGTRASGAGRVRAQRWPAKGSARAGGAGRGRRSAASTRAPDERVCAS